MSLPRPTPDKPRIPADERSWIEAAGRANASVWQVVTFTQQSRDNVYRIWRLAGITTAPQRHSRKLTPQQDRAIRVDYVDRDADGQYRYSVAQVAARNGVSLSMVEKVCRRWGLRRYLTRRRAA
jgi:hypothetical protein